MSSMNRISTGVAGLDTLIQGGLPQGRSYLVCGESGVGKTTLSVQFLVEGCKQGEKGVYITIDEKPEHIIENSESLGWEITRLLEQKQIEFLDISAYFSAQKTLSDPLNFNRVIKNILQFAEDRHAKRVVIDPISPLIFSRQHHPDLPYYIRKLIFSLEEKQCYTTLLTSPIPTGSSSISRNGIEEFISSGIIILKLEKQDDQYIRTLQVKKMRGVDIDPNSYPFNITAHHGIVVLVPTPSTTQLSFQ